MSSSRWRNSFASVGASLFGAEVRRRYVEYLSSPYVIMTTAYWGAAVLIALFVDGLLRWVGVVGAAVALVLSVLGEAGRGRKVPVGLGYTVAANPVRRGDDLEVRLTAPPGMMVEVGVRTVEVTIAGSPGRSRSTNRTVIDEQWAPAPTASRAAVRIPADAIPTYIGEWLSIRHEVVLHPAELPREDARGDITVEVAVVP